LERRVISAATCAQLEEKPSVKSATGYLMHIQVMIAIRVEYTEYSLYLFCLHNRNIRLTEVIPVIVQILIRIWTITHALGFGMDW
jgi:hypothetical protein